MNKVSIYDRIHSIVNQSKNLLNEFNFEEELKLDYVAVQAKDNEDYDFLNEEASKLGVIYEENNTGITYELINPIETANGDLNILKIRQPGEKNFEGYPDYSVENYEEFKSKHKDEVIVMTAEDGVEILELKKDGHDVMIYIPSIPISEDIKKANMLKNKNNAVDELKAKLEEETARRLNVMAEFDNYRKRIEGEKAMFGAMANMGLIQELLEINDDLQLALTDDQLDLERAKQSIKTAQDKLKGAASTAGIEAVEVKVGDEFNKEIMEAIQAVPNEEMKGKVIAVISSAYKYANKEGVLKAAKVIVGK